MLQHFVINPTTGRRIKVGGPMYKKLIKQGMLEPNENDENVVGDYDSNDDNEYTQDMINEYNKELPSNQHCVRGRGAYKNKLVKRSKVPSFEDVVEHTAKATKKVLKKSKKISDEEETELERLITEELLKLQPKQTSRTKKPVKKGRASKFSVKQVSESESSSEDDDTE